jgi:hypothetical protein
MQRRGLKTDVTQCGSHHEVIYRTAYFKMAGDIIRHIRN